MPHSEQLTLLAFILGPVGLMCLAWIGVEVARINSELRQAPLRQGRRG